MTDPRPELSFRSVVLDAPDVAALGAFYQRLLGWTITSEPGDPTWLRMEPEGGGTGLAIQLEPHYVPPVWPAEPTGQQMQLHVDLKVDDLAAAARFAEQCGARLASFQPDDDVRVFLDPVGHPFCLFEQ
jgi:catechol 2,3-dioxygenase-like lactoylglutathione lyase family enzyme